MNDGDKRKGSEQEPPATDESAAAGAAQQPDREAAEAPSVEPSEVDQLREQLGQLQARLRTVSKAYNDLQAEMKSYRDRTDAQLKLSKERQAFDTVRAFFDPVMNLKRSVAAIPDESGVVREGLQMVHQQFMQALEGLGLQKVPGEGATFDPYVHEALVIQPVADPAQDGKVLLVHADGYAVNGKVLQPAQVVIGKHERPQGEA